ncbi:MAG: response regulator [Planctomycetota bacterium]
MKSVFTTGEVAVICNVSQQTIIRCFDNGRLKGFRVPGSRFRRIPRDCLVDFMREHQIPPDHLDSGKKRILVVDDDLAIVEMFTELLVRDGRFEIRTATTGYDAGLITHEFRPDVMLLDFKLPDINGNIVCKSVRAQPGLQHMKIIIISGVADPDEVKGLLRAGADEFIKKPFEIDAVISRIAELLKV